MVFVGQLSFSAYPSDKNGKALGENACLDDPKELLGKPFFVNFTVKGAKGIPTRFESSFVTFGFNGQRDAFKSEEVSKPVNVQYNSNKVWGMKKVEKEFIEYLTNEFLLIEIYGRQQDGTRKATMPATPAGTNVDGGPGKESAVDAELQSQLHMWKKRAERSENKLVFEHI